MKPSLKTVQEQQKVQCSSSHVKTLLKIKKQRTQGTIKPPIPVTGPISSTARTSFKPGTQVPVGKASTPKLMNADLAKAGLNQFTYYHANQTEFQKIVHKKPSMKDQDRIEYKQLKNAQAKQVKKELNQFESRQKEEKQRTKKNFELMDSMLEDLNQWRQKRSKQEAEPQIRSNNNNNNNNNNRFEEVKDEDDINDPIYLTDLKQQVEEESHHDRALFDKKFKQAYANHKIPTKGQSQKVMNAEKEAEQILNKYEKKKSDYDKLQELYDSKIKREIMELESKGQFLDKQIDIINQNSKEEKKIFDQIDDITSDIQKWESDLANTLKDLTWLENSQKLKVASIQEQDQEDIQSKKGNQSKKKSIPLKQQNQQQETNTKYNKKIKQLKSRVKKVQKTEFAIQDNEFKINIQDPNLQKMLDDIDNEFKSIDDLLK